MERWDLYTCDRERTGRTIQRGEPIPEGMYRLVVHVCIFDTAGRLLIQRRQIDKSGWADLWDLTVGGHVIAGETSREAAQRETAEELGIQISVGSRRPAVSLTFPNGFDDMYIFVQDIAIDELTLQEEEVQDARWATKEEICAMIDEGTFIPYHQSLIDLLFFLRNHPEIHIS